MQFLRSNPRYQEALTLTRDPRAFARALQQAGYATEPAYAQKILDIYAMGATPLSPEGTIRQCATHEDKVKWRALTCGSIGKDHERNRQEADGPDRPGWLGTP